MSEPPTLYEWVKGRPAIARLIDAFYDRVERDDLLSPLFPGGVSAAHREHVTTWWCEVLGGPADYTQRLGGYPAMVAHHRDLGITPEQRFRFASLMMGVWFTSLAVGNRIGGWVAGHFDPNGSLPGLFLSVAAFAIGSAVLLAALTRPIKKLMAGVH